MCTALRPNSGRISSGFLMQFKGPHDETSSSSRIVPDTLRFTLRKSTSIGQFELGVPTELLPSKKERICFGSGSAATTSTYGSLAGRGISSA